MSHFSLLNLISHFSFSFLVSHSHFSLLILISRISFSFLTSHSHFSLLILISHVSFSFLMSHSHFPSPVLVSAHVLDTGQREISENCRESVSQSACLLALFLWVASSDLWCLMRSTYISPHAGVLVAQSSFNGRKSGVLVLRMCRAWDGSRFEIFLFVKSPAFIFFSCDSLKCLGVVTTHLIAYSCSINSVRFWKPAAIFLLWKI